MLKIGKNWGKIANYPPPNAQKRSAPLPVTILQAYFSLPRHIRKGMLIRWIIMSDAEIYVQQF